MKEEKPYQDRKISVISTEEKKLSDLTKEERDIYFAGVAKGFRDGMKIIGIVTIVIIIILAIALVISLPTYPV